MAELPVRYADGAEGRAVGYANLWLDLIAPRPFAPGQPLSFALQFGEQALSLAGKSHGARAREDGHFAVRVRLTNLRREARLALEQAFAAVG
jgi:hypothetical protein